MIQNLIMDFSKYLSNTASNDYLNKSLTRSLSSGKDGFRDLLSGTKPISFSLPVQSKDAMYSTKSTAKGYYSVDSLSNTKNGVQKTNAKDSQDDLKSNAEKNESKLLLKEKHEISENEKKLSKNEKNKQIPQALQGKEKKLNPKDKNERTKEIFEKENAAELLSNHAENSKETAANIEENRLTKGTHSNRLAQKGDIADNAEVPEKARTQAVQKGLESEIEVDESDAHTHLVYGQEGDVIMAANKLQNNEGSSVAAEEHAIQVTPRTHKKDSHLGKKEDWTRLSLKKAIHQETLMQVNQKGIEKQATLQLREKIVSAEVDNNSSDVDFDTQELDNQQELTSLTKLDYQELNKQQKFQGEIVMIRNYMRAKGNQDLVQQAKIILRNNKEGEIKITLSPKEFGEVKLSFLLEDNKIMGRMVVNNETAKDALQKNMENLMRQFNQDGYEVGDFFVSVDSNNSEHEKRRQENISLNNDMLQSEDDTRQLFIQRYIGADSTLVDFVG